MRIPEIDPETLAAARAGELAALDGILVAIQPGIYNLAVRMLGHREDARDATQEILLKVVTHLGSFRGEAAFSTWVFRVAQNHLRTAATRARETPEVSWEELDERLGQGIAYAQAHGERTLSPADKTEAREVAVGCTQGMLLRLDRDQRVAYVLDTVFALSSDQAAEVLEITPAAYRKRLSRARQEIHEFAGKTCGLVNPEAPCRCERQLPALHALRAQGGQSDRLQLEREELAEAEAHFDRLSALTDTAAVFRAHPQYQAPGELVGAIRAVLRRDGFWPEAAA